MHVSEHTCEATIKNQSEFSSTGSSYLFAYRCLNRSLRAFSLSSFSCLAVATETPPP